MEFMAAGCWLCGCGPDDHSQSRADGRGRERDKFCASERARIGNNTPWPSHPLLFRGSDSSATDRLVVRYRIDARHATGNIIPPGPHHLTNKLQGKTGEKREDKR